MSFSSTYLLNWFEILYLFSILNVAQLKILFKDRHCVNGYPEITLVPFDGIFTTIFPHFIENTFQIPRFTIHFMLFKFKHAFFTFIKRSEMLNYFFFSPLCSSNIKTNPEQISPTESIAKGKMKYSSPITSSPPLLSLPEPLLSRENNFLLGFWSIPD